MAEAPTVSLSHSRTAIIEDRPRDYDPTHTEKTAVIFADAETLISAQDAINLATALNDGDRLQEVADTILRAQYYSSVRSYAEDIADDVKRGDIADRESLIERVDSTVDGSSWVIYTASALQVLRYSDNDSAYIDEFGSEGIADSGTINWSLLAYGALHADLLEQLDSALSPGDVNRPFSCDECSQSFEAYSDLHHTKEADGTTMHLCEDCHDARESDHSA